MRPKISLREALAEPALLGHVMQGSSWYGWRVLLIAAAGEELTDDERQEFKRLTGREREPGRLCRELVVIAGRRGGKTTAVVVFDIWIAALCDHRGTLAPGETGVALLISRDQRVARMLLDRIYGIMCELRTAQLDDRQPNRGYHRAAQWHFDRGSPLQLQNAPWSDLHFRHLRRVGVLVHQRRLRQS